jgi:hypothetical protein
VTERKERWLPNKEKIELKLEPRVSELNSKLNNPDPTRNVEPGVELSKKNLGT